MKTIKILFTLLLIFFIALILIVLSVIFYLAVLNTQSKQEMSFEQGLATTNGRPKRQAIETFFHQKIENIYQQTSNQLSI